MLSCMNGHCARISFIQPGFLSLMLLFYGLFNKPLDKRASVKVTRGHDPAFCFVLAWATGTPVRRARLSCLDVSLWRFLVLFLFVSILFCCALSLISLFHALFIFPTTSLLSVSHSYTTSPFSLLPISSPSVSSLFPSPHFSLTSLSPSPTPFLSLHWFSFFLPLFALSSTLPHPLPSPLHSVSSAKGAKGGKGET